MSVVRWAILNRLAAPVVVRSVGFIFGHGFDADETAASIVTSDATTSAPTSIAVTRALFMTEVGIQRKEPLA